MKKALAILLSVLLLMACVPLGAVSVSAESAYNGMAYTIANGEATITGYTADLPANVVIPSTVEGYPVTAIGDEAFYDCSSLTSVTIPDSVTYIGESAFSYCTALTSVTIPDSVTTIGSRAFERDGALTTVTVGEGVTSIGQWAFASCYGLTAIVVDTANSKYSSVDGVLFNKDQTILIQYPNGKTDASYTVPNGVTAIADWAFYNSHRYLTSVTISDSVTTIGADAFCWCDNLKSVSFGKNVTTIGDEAFYPMSIADVYYDGTEEDKANISIGDRNSGLLNATWHYAEVEGSRLEAGETVTVTITEGGEVIDFFFTPTVSGDYIFGSLSYDDTYGYLLDADGNELAYNDDGGEETNFRICHYLTAGTTYILRTRYYSSTIGAYEVYLVRYGDHGYDADCDDTCNYCGELRYTYAAHTYDGDCDDSCDECGEWREPPHCYDDDCDHACNWCLAYREAPHNYDYDCDEWCNDCGAWREPPHNYSSDCDEWCNDCGVWRYTYAAHTYDGDCDDSCDECGEWREPPHCYDDDCDYECNWCLAWREAPHNYDYDCDDECNVCGESRVTYTDHYYYDEWDEYCYYCNEWREVIYPGCSHDYDNDCDPECNWCYEWREVYHDYDYDCDDECNVCGESRVTYTDHYYCDEWDEYCDYCGEWREVIYPCFHDYDNACDPECNWCYEWREVSHTYDDTADAVCNGCGLVRYLTYTITNGEVTITGYTADLPADLVIPSTIEGCPVTKIDSQAFYGCDSLRSVFIPASVHSILYGAFGDCASLTSLVVDSANPYYVTVDDVLFEKDGSALIQCPAGKEGDYVIPDGVTYIDDTAFVGCSKLTAVTIPNGVNRIGFGAFAGCTSLTEVTIPNGVTSILDSAFSSCTSLVSVSLPNSITDFGDHVFDSCTALTTVHIENGTAFIGYKAFNNCTALTDVYYGGIEAERNIRFEEGNDLLINATWHYAEPAIVYGDTNGDGGINNRDLVLLLRYVNGWNVTLDLAAADVNGDGRTNNRDVVLLQRYINGWDVQLGPDTPLVALPELGYDPDGKGRIILSAIAKNGNEVSVTFVNVSSRWMTEETCYIKYICTDADGNVLTLDDTYYGYIYFGMLEAGWTKTFTITLPEGTAKMEFGDYRIVYWTQWA